VIGTNIRSDYYVSRYRADRQEQNVTWCVTYCSYIKVLLNNTGKTFG